MSNTPQNDFITQEERRALGWLWRTYLRRRIPRILGVTALVTIQSLSMLAFLELMRSSIGSFFNASNGVFVLQEAAADANGDGTYEVTMAIEETDIVLNLSVLEGQSPSGDGTTGFDPIALADAQGISVGDRALSLSGPDGALFTFVSAQTQATLFWLVAALSFVMVLRAVCSYLAARFAAKISIEAGLEIRLDLIRNLLGLDLAYFDVTPTGRLVNRIFGMVGKLQAFFSREIVVNANHALTILVILIYLAWIHVGLFSFAFLVLPIAVLGVRYATLRIRRYTSRTNAAMAAFLTAVENTLGGIRTIKLTNQTERATRRLEANSREMATLGYAIARNQAIVSPFVDLLAAVFFVLVLGLGGLAVIHEWAGITATTLITFAVALGLIFDPARVLSRFNATLSSMLVSLQEVHEMSLERPTIRDAADARTEFRARGDIEFRDVSFAYQGAEDLLFDGLNLRFPGGRTSAIVGQTGTGKSTLLSLLARLYEPKNGAILIDGQDINALDSFALRQAFGVVSQDIFVFDANIVENIRFVRPEATIAQVEDAAKQAQLSDLMEERGSQTIGPRGAQLSGGQKQRIAIARAFLQDAPIILLDEATSALDQQTEAKITAALKTLCNGRTTLIIAHRLSTITHADQIVVLDGGKLAEQGTHDALMTEGGLYAALYNAQASGVKLVKPKRWWHWGSM